MTLGLRSMACSLLLIGLMSIGLSGCLSFGKDIEVLEPNVGPQELQKITSLTGITFPAGAKGLAYYYEDSGIDDALAAKILIPDTEKDLFLQNAVFTQGDHEQPHIQIGSDRPWWKLSGLTNRIDRSLNLPQGRYLECT